MVHKRRLKDRRVGAADKEDISVVDLEDEVEALDVVGEETFGFQAEEEAGTLEEGLDRDLEDDTMQ